MVSYDITMPFSLVLSVLVKHSMPTILWYQPEIVMKSTPKISWICFKLYILGISCSYKHIVTQFNIPINSTTKKQTSIKQSSFHFDHNSYKYRINYKKNQDIMSLKPLLNYHNLWLELQWTTKSRKYCHTRHTPTRTGSWYQKANKITYAHLYEVIHQIHPWEIRF